MPEIINCSVSDDGRTGGFLVPPEFQVGSFGEHLIEGMTVELMDGRKGRIKEIYSHIQTHADRPNRVAVDVEVIE